MKTLALITVLIAGCAGVQPAQDNSTTPCQNITQEYTVGVPYPWDVMDDEETTTMANGCKLTIITHYVLDNGSGGGAGGSAPDPLHCDVDGCGGPLLKSTTYTDPAPVVVQNAIIISTP